MTKRSRKNATSQVDQTHPPATPGLAEKIRTPLFETLAQSCAKGCDDLAAREMLKPASPRLRLFSTWEITRYLIPVAPGHLRRVLKQNPDLPQGQAQSEGTAKWFTLEEVGQLRRYFGNRGSQAKDYLPFRPKGVPARVVALANLRAGVGKTTTTAHLAMAAALEGYRVLVIDLDAQAGLTRLFGGEATDEWQTVFPLLARHYARQLQSDNQRRLDRGEPPVPLDETLSDALNVTGTDLIQPTHWPGIDLLGAQLTLCRTETLTPVWRMQSPGWKPWSALSESLASDGLLERYDMIFLDTPPALGALTLAGLAAAHILLVPTGASAVEFEATGQALGILHKTFSGIETAENTAARALGQAGLTFEWDALCVVITRYHDTDQAGMAALMQSCLGPALLPHRQAVSGLVGAGAGQVRAIYEADYRDTNRETYARARESFDQVYGAVRHLVIEAWRRDAQAGHASPDR